MGYWVVLFIAIVVTPNPLSAGVRHSRQLPENDPTYVNSEGIKMIRIPAGSFLMGNSAPTDPAILKQSPTIKNGDADERPAHQVRITYDFYMSETEITARQWKAFHNDYVDIGPSSPYATGISWNEAVAYCAWLSKKEGRLYRLPTEAEWEYASRAGSKGNFFTGDLPPKSGEANPWGLKNMNTDAAEWVLDWYGPYPDAPQTDPVGPATGYAKVIRGGGYLGSEDSKKYPNDGRLPYFRRSANRASAAPIFRGRHNIGFRIVQAPLPTTKPWPEVIPFASQLVKERNAEVMKGPNRNQPWYRVRDVFPVPPEDSSDAAIEAAGLTAPLMGYNHSPGLIVCPNGDLLAVYVSSKTPGYEDLSNVNIVAARRRFGSDQWDMPGPFFDFADGKDSSPTLWRDGDTDTIYFFSGGGPSDIPFRWRTSQDNGATWSPVHFPTIIGLRGAYYPQPTNSVARAADGTLYLPSDSQGASSLLWVSHDNGRTWSDAGGRTAGRHSSITLLKNGGILAMGGKSSSIDGYMPKAISHDGGKTWVVSKTPFPAVGESGQRPTLIRLADGKLLFAGDWQNAHGQSPAAITQRGAYVALSSDGGETWHIKSLPNVPVNDAYALRNRPHWKKSTFADGTLGYSVARQSPDGLIHLITSRTYPAREFEMNEAWILSNSDAPTPEQSTTGGITHEQETYPNGAIKVRWNVRRDTSGRFVLDGPETWFFPDGKKEYDAEWHDGQKVGDETLWDVNGHKVWEWNHNPDGVSVWTHYWPNGLKKSESQWRDQRCTGTATEWDKSGTITARHKFSNGVMDGEFSR